MKENFDDALKAILKHEGGYVNHPKDPGGMTNLGVTKKVWEAWVGKAVGEKEMRALTPEV
jgi:lysozyme family protein